LKLALRAGNPKFYANAARRFKAGFLAFLPGSALLTFMKSSLVWSESLKVYNVLAIAA
jgi:hypothetical protein